MYKNIQNGVSIAKKKKKNAWNIHSQELKLFMILLKNVLPEISTWWKKEEKNACNEKITI